MTETNTAPEPTGGWQQYRIALWVLVLYPVLILGTALAIIPFLSQFHQTRQKGEIVSSTSHEPFHLSLSTLAPVKPAANRS